MHDPQEIRRTAHQILAKPEFGDVSRTWWANVVYYISHPLMALQAGLAWIFRRLPHGGAQIGAWVVVIAAVVFLTFLVIRWTRTIRSDSAARFGKDPALLDQSAAELAQAARRCEEVGDWRGAIRNAYGALLAELETRGIVQRRSGRTTGEYWREASVNAPHTQEPLGRATMLFDEVWYGRREPNQSDVADFRMAATQTTHAAAA